MEEMQAVAEAAPEVIEETPAVPEVETPSALKTTPSRMEALEKAFKSTEAEPAKEPTKEPAKDEGPTRGPDGKFVAKETPVDVPKAPEAPMDVKTAHDAPARFSADAKAAWDAAPLPVKAEINRAITEMERGLAEKDQVIAPLKPFLDMAKQHNVDFAQTVSRYVAMEQLLARDPIKGFEALANNMGMTLAQLGERITGQVSQPNAKDNEILTLKQEIEGLKSQFGQVSQTVQQQRENAVLENVQRFASEKPRFDELAPEMTRLLQTGYAQDLQHAYEIADRLNPAPQPAPVATPAVPLQQRMPRSVTGAPTTGSNPANRQPSASRTEALARAFAQTGLS